MLEIFEKAKKFGREAHDSIGHVRKYTNEPYWVHTEEVADLILKSPVGYLPSHNIAVIAAYLHDIIEDVFPKNPKYDLYLIAKLFGNEVAKVVNELTDVYTPENYPDLNRKKRKKLEAERLSKISPIAKMVKLADIISNTKSIVEYDRGFAIFYLEEKEVILPLIRDGSEELYQIALKQLTEAKALLKS